MADYRLPSSSVRPHYARKHILLVDNDPGLRATAAFLLVQAGYEVSQTHDGCKALDLVRSSLLGNTPFDLIIAEVMVRKLSGMDLLMALRTNGVFIPILVIAGVLDADVLKELRKIGPLGIILKPFMPEEFIEHVHHLISGRHCPAGQIAEHRFKV